MMKAHGISEAKAYLEGLDERDVMEMSMLATLDYLDSHNMKGHAMPEYGMIELKFGGSSWPLTMKIDFDSDREVATACVVMPGTCIKEKRTVVSELLHRINFVTVLGQWKLDLRDGECQLKYTHFIGDTPMSLRQAERMVDISLFAAHRYEDTLIPLMMGQDPNMDDACDEYKEMMGAETSLSSFREMLLRAAAEAKRKKDSVAEGAAIDLEDDGKA